MADEPSLPRLACDPINHSFLSGRARKRVRLESPLISSDPALFSSDDDPSAENYTQGRRKQTYRGPWYSQRPASDQDSQDFPDNPKKSKRTFERQFDSGVWLGSDGTDLDESADGMLSNNESWNLPMRQSRAIQTKDDPPSPEVLAREQIELCLEEGNESIDLSSQCLTLLSNATIRPLAAFSCVPPVTEGVFSRIEPMLKIFLASNNLTKLPAELFNLNSLTVLSLRANRIYELPPGIGKLRNLQELNISQNGMQYLPFEILDLFSEDHRLQTFIIHPNNFFQARFPEQESAQIIQKDLPYKIGLGNRARPRRVAPGRISADERRRPFSPQWEVSYKARTEVRFLDINGSHLKGPNFSNQILFGPQKFNELPVAAVGDIPTPPLPRGNQLSRAPSLLEVALVACSRTPQLPYLQSMLPKPCPEYFPRLLATVAAKKESGTTKCTICDRDFIVPRTEWIEWWEIAKRVGEKGMASAASPLRQMENERDVLERMVPLMRRGCSWLCVPETLNIEWEKMAVTI
ncbi:Leucine-rich repeat SHOC-2 [Hyphodiscus hymeniophilus]|uniref:Leucine-rich repeat SHOC-2 n=1 Tax=Hyphodiscus hymeniophilus TaxID=353542 RepID=A0A9P6VMW6_9HELO|nr:Leucine-rich repeat SHOC-2 [Hyphodiscus hymeniophilus]